MRSAPPNSRMRPPCTNAVRSATWWASSGRWLTFKTAEAEKPGATLIEFPEDVAKEESDEPPMAAVKTHRPGADHKVVRQAVDLIARAKRPLILAGNGAVRKRAARQLRRFAHKTGIGVVNTFMGKGAVWIARYYQCETANTCLISNGFCSMGFALPGAMGAKLAHPDRKVLAIAGDAGFLINVQDLETLVRPASLDVTARCADADPYRLSGGTNGSNRVISAGRSSFTVSHTRRRSMSK